MKHLFHSGKFLLMDFLSTIFFVALFALTRNIYLATAVGIGLAAAQIAWTLARRRPVDAMQWMSLGLVAVFGGASLWLHDPRFIMFKPTLVYIVIGAVMLRPGWMVRYLPPVAMEVAGDLAFGFGYVWAGMMFLTAALNAVAVFTFSQAVWAGFVTLFPLVSKLALFLIQYATMRVIGGRRRAVRQVGGSQAPHAA